ncbi:MAG TPA: cold shock domain-containing protein [Cyclobacteriaceae bacterium]|nr:cold shock domain-containing protein [Cyclobacteriaceae bacterium]
MAKSQETFSKKEAEKKKLQKRKAKEQRKEERKANAKSGSLEDMMAYVDEYGNITSTPPDPLKRKAIRAEDIVLGARNNVKANPEDAFRKGKVTFFNEAKGYGFIRDLQSQESIFVHVNSLTTPIKEGDKVTFEVEHGPKGLSAVRVKMGS